MHLGVRVTVPLELIHHVQQASQQVEYTLVWAVLQAHTHTYTHVKQGVLGHKLTRRSLQVMTREASIWTLMIEDFLHNFLHTAEKSFGEHNVERLNMSLIMMILAADALSSPADVGSAEC